MPLSVKRQTPLGNVWTWIYEQAGLTTNKFHNQKVPDDFDASESQKENFLRRQQHLENAIKWSKERAIQCDVWTTIRVDGKQDWMPIPRE